ncbi:hypothetical protein AKJ09_01873 [Labilithrix luteola]|uniref:Type IV fimbrial biogenesis protein PilY1 n=1 Tax=Labilithrix luteola TaxID=1391654 RepID=A0A0K1PQ35_9BACT|nr:hypothetical protein [Labilithrix luteola]AKU95209.1 hypothetical protein AKJ09_01873 [Labilithrix luteola]
MKARTIGALSSVAGTLALLVACAADDETSRQSLEADGGTLPVQDGGADALEDAAEPSDPCVPDALCPNGPVDPSGPGGGLDVRTRINVIRGRSESDVWAAGAVGAMFHFDGTSWKPSPMSSAETMNGLWLRDANEIAVSSLTSVYTRGLEVTDGADASAPSSGGWIARGAPATPDALGPSAVVVTSSWAASGGTSLWSTLRQFEGGGLDTAPNGLWRLRVDPSTNALEFHDALEPGACALLGCRRMSSVHGISADDLWAVGYSGVTFHITNAESATPTITPFDSRTWAGLNGVWAAAENDVWAVGGAGVIRHYTGHSYAWDVVSDVPTTETLHAIYGTSGSDIWAVGDNAVVLHYDGAHWSRVKVAGLGGRLPHLMTVWTPAPGHVWIGGDGVILSLGGTP